MKLNLGANTHRLEGFVSVDAALPADELADLSVLPWPWESDSVDEVFARDIFEHLPNKIGTMNELHRILRAGATAFVSVPTISGVGSVCDPTHRSFWSAADFAYYEVGSAERERFADPYGITAAFSIRFIALREYTHRFGEIIRYVEVVLEAVK